VGMPKMYGLVVALLIIVVLVLFIMRSGWKVAPERAGLHRQTHSQPSYL
jgi:hypothetical protein